MSVELRRRARPSGPAQPVDRPRADGEPGRRGGGWGWILQVVTGAALLVLVVVHLVAQHFVVSAPGGLRDRASVLVYLGNPVIVVIESLFMLTVTWHALLGVRSILFDLVLGPRARRRVTVGLTALGVVTLGYGFWMIAVLAAG
ncbi:hypothetical protein [Cellulomonas sp. SG140]|uniref:hypothetical protein n=1 Tax=Cellulomonas sp. SG140 TaxID=2976536 RepID=UPI0021E78B45|nr:hypothetical protein [Cellulomonas sp. SG140]